MNQPLLDDQDEFYPDSWGFPAHLGIGKTTAIRESFPNVIEIRMSEIDIEDIRGLLVVPHKGGTNALRK